MLFDGFPKLRYRTDSWDGHHIFAHNLLNFHSCSLRGRFLRQDWNLLHHNGLSVERGREEVGYNPGNHDSHHHGDEDVDGGTSFKHDHDK